MSFIVHVVAFFGSSLVGVGVTTLVFHFFTRNLGPSAPGALILWPIWLLIYFCSGAVALSFLM
jgi:hypothetical protein